MVYKLTRYAEHNSQGIQILNVQLHVYSPTKRVNGRSQGKGGLGGRQVSSEVEGNVPQPSPPALYNFAHESCVISE